MFVLCCVAAMLTRRDQRGQGHQEMQREREWKVAGPTSWSCSGQTPRCPVEREEHGYFFLCLLQNDHPEKHLEKRHLLFKKK